MRYFSGPALRGFAFGFLVSCFSTLAGEPPASQGAASVQSIRLVPFPKEVKVAGSPVALRADFALTAPEGISETLAQLLNSELKLAGLPPVRAMNGPLASNQFVLAAFGRSPAQPELPANAPKGAYSLDVSVEGISCSAADLDGLRYGMQTLCQLIRANRSVNTIPQVRIYDWPSLRWRAFQDDMTRGPSSRIETLQFQASLAAQLKFNLMTYYMEHQFAFKKHPAIGPRNGSLTAEELAKLVECARPLGVEILGNQQSFGHFFEILKHPQYARLREMPHILSPVFEDSYKLLNDFYSEVCPVLPFPWFNVCCDETQGLGTGPSADLAAQIGVGGVYVQHINRVHSLLKTNHNKRMMMWGDIILQHPKHLDAIPKDTIMLTWAYDPRDNFESQIIPFAKSGFEFFVCPGVSDWSRILPDFGVATTNIRHFVRDGVKHGALGMINTDWLDDGEGLKAAKWHVDAWAAECAWNASRTTPEDFNRRVGAVLFGERGGRFGQAIDLLGQTHRLPGMKGMFNTRFWERDFVPAPNPAFSLASASNLLAVVRPAIGHLEACRKEAICNQHILEVMLFGARRMELIGERMIAGWLAAEAYQRAEQRPGARAEIGESARLVREIREQHADLRKEFARLWDLESEPYALDWTLKRYDELLREYDDRLKKLRTAEDAAAAGKPLPTAFQVGLARVGATFRLSETQTSTKPMLRSAPWAVSDATHRLGIEIDAGKVNRLPMPIQARINVPKQIVGNAIRAFVRDDQGADREIPAQLSERTAGGFATFVMMLDEPLKARETVRAWLYFGALATNMPTAARCQADTEKGRFWLENDQLRLLLGETGAHIYRWELKHATNRDLTMPGETGWAGFAARHSTREDNYVLHCKANGPAMVDFEAFGSSGDSFSIRLYAGVSWVETLASDPVTMYWNYDDPANFASDGPTPGQYLFSNGKSGPVGAAEAGKATQVYQGETRWSLKFNSKAFALGLATPGRNARHGIGPGGGMGGVGIEGGPPVRHFVTFGGLLTNAPSELMNGLEATLNLDDLPLVRIFRFETH